MPHMHTRLISPLGLFAALALAVAFGISGPPARAASTASPVIYVDGKHGSDSNSGTSIGSAFKTIAAGMTAIRGSGRLEIVGYNDYVYYEKPTGPYWVLATASNPAVIEAYGYGTPGYVRPIISGATVVNRPGSSLWYRPDPSAYPDVWATSWKAAIPGYEQGDSLMTERLYMDVTQPLGRPSETPTLAQLQATPASEYWNGSTLYVRLGLWGGTLADTNPNHHTIEIPTYDGLLIGSGSAYVTIQGLCVRHAYIGMGVTGTGNHITIQDVDASYNYLMGFFSASGYNTFRNVSGSRNTIQLIKLDNGANHNLVDHAVGTQNIGQGIKVTGADTAFNTVQDSVFSDGLSIPAWTGGNGGGTQGVDIQDGAHDNLIQGNTIADNPRGLMLYQVSSTGAPLTGNVITENHFTGNRYAVVLWDGRLSTAGSTGAVTFSDNVYDGNAQTVVSQATTSNKVFDHETVYDTGKGQTVDNAFSLEAGSITVRNSIVDGVGGYAFYALGSSSINVYDTTVVDAGLGVLYGNVAWTTQTASTTYVPFGPVRVLDTRIGLGCTGPVWNRSPKTLQVAGANGIPADAVAVTGNLTITGQSAPGYVSITVNPTSHPETSTINFPKGDNRANGVTVPLNSKGQLSFVFVSTTGAKVQVILDITGYFRASGGAQYQPVGPVRVLDSRIGAGFAGPLANRQPKTFAVAGVAGVPSDAIAVTGNLTVTGQTRYGYVSLTSEPTSDPATSTLNFPKGDTRANGVTMPLAADGTLSAVYVAGPGATVQVIFDVTGYYVAPDGKAQYVPIEPGRILDTRIQLGISAPLGRYAPVTFQVAGRYLVPSVATAITGNVTVTGQKSTGYVSLTTVPAEKPATSTINFPVGDTRANGFAAPLDKNGRLSATFVGPGASTQLIIDVTGYFLPAGASLVDPDFALDPDFLSVSPASPLYLHLSTDSPVYGLGSDGLPLGADFS